MKVSHITLILMALVLLSMPVIQAKSLPKAMLMSAVLPGSGEIYAGDLTRGVVFTTIDLVLLFNANRFDNEVKWLEDSYKQFAYSKAGITKDRSNDYYELLHKWYNSDIYNNEVELYFRNLGLVNYNDPNYYADEISYYSITEDDSWHWANERDWNKYKSIRRDKQTQIMHQKLAIGAAIANRVISIVDAAILVRRYNKKINPTFSITPDFINNGAILNCSWEF